MGYKLPEHGAHKAHIIEKNGSTLSNLVVGQRLNGGNGVMLTAAMSPVGFYEVYPKSGSILGELARQLDVPNPTLDFKLSAQNGTLLDLDNKGPKFS